MCNLNLRSGSPSVYHRGGVVALGASFLLVSRLERLAARMRLSEAALGLVVALAADSPEITSRSPHPHTVRPASERASFWGPMCSTSPRC